MNKDKLDNFQGLTKELIHLFDFKTIKFDRNKCTCDILVEPKNCNSNGEIDNGTLIALIDSFSSYAIMFLVPKENYKHYLSVNISMISFKETTKNDPKITIKVTLEKQYERNILLDIRVYDSTGNEIKHLSHLKRKLASKL